MSKRRPGHYVIGLTGNIATGKSKVMASLRQLGACIINADDVAHQVMASQDSVREAIIRAFGANVLRPDGQIDRTALGRVVFKDPHALQQLEGIVHPRVIADIDTLIERAAEEVVVVEAIKLIETGMHRHYDALWVVASPPEQQIKRLINLRGLSADAAQLRLDAQPPQRDKIAQADVVICNAGSVEDLERQVVAQWHRVQQQLTKSER